MKKNLQNRQKFYQSVSDDREKGGYYKEKVQFIEEVLPSKKLTILDIGCNDGYFAERLISKGHQVTGVDISKEALHIAKKRGVKTFEIDVENETMPFPGSSFDVVILGDIIEHVFDTDKLLSQVHNLLKDNGKLIISTPNVASLGRRIMLLVGISPYLEYSIVLSTNNLPSVGHIRYYTFKILENQLKICGFTPILLKGDVVNIGPFTSRNLARVFPTLSRQIFMLAEKNKL